MTYGYQTRSLTKASVKKLETSQRPMGRNMINVKLKDRICNTIIIQRTRVTNIAQYVTNTKWKLAEHIRHPGTRPVGDGRLATQLGVACPMVKNCIYIHIVQGTSVVCQALACSCYLLCVIAEITVIWTIYQPLIYSILVHDFGSVSVDQLFIVYPLTTYCACLIASE